MHLCIALSTGINAELHKYELFLAEEKSIFGIVFREPYYHPLLLHQNNTCVRHLSIIWSFKWSILL